MEALMYSIIMAMPNRPIKQLDQLHLFYLDNYVPFSADEWRLTSPELYGFVFVTPGDQFSYFCFTMGVSFCLSFRVGNLNLMY